MKKISLTIVTLFVSLLLVSCDINVENNNGTKDTNEEIITFVEAELTSLIGTYEPSEGTIFLKVKIKFEYEMVQNASLVDFYCSLDIGSYGIMTIEEYLNGFNLYETGITNQLIWFVFELENDFLTSDEIDILEVKIYDRFFEISEEDL